MSSIYESAKKLFLKQLEEEKKRSSGDILFKIPNGTTRLRLLPLEDSIGGYIEEILYHGIGKGQDFKQVLCTGDKCKYCKKGIKRQKKFFALAIVYNKESNIKHKLAYIFLNTTVINQLAMKFYGDDEEVDFEDKDFINWNKSAYMVKIIRKGEGLDTTYDVSLIQKEISFKNQEEFDKAKEMSSAEVWKEKLLALYGVKKKKEEDTDENWIEDIDEETTTHNLPSKKKKSRQKEEEIEWEDEDDVFEDTETIEEDEELEEDLDDLEDEI